MWAKMYWLNFNNKKIYPVLVEINEKTVPYANTAELFGMMFGSKIKQLSRKKDAGEAFQLYLHNKMLLTNKFWNQLEYKEE